MPTIHYLQWQGTPGDRRDEAADLFHKFHHDPPDTLDEDAFDRLYEEVAAVATDDLEQLFAAWNRGIVRASDRFQEFRYCERCHTYVEGSGEAATHAGQKHGYDPVQDPGAPAYLRGIRSLSVGDVVARDDTYYVCATVGWQEIELATPDSGPDDQGSYSPPRPKRG